MIAAPALRPYQEKCLDAIVAARESGLTRLLVQAATGVGKTQIFASLPTRLKPWLDTFPAGSRRFLIIAHRDELLEQAAARIQSLNPGLMVSIEQGPRVANRYADVVIASIQTLSAMKYRRLKHLMGPQGFRVVIYDECHHISSPTARTSLVHLGFLPPGDASDTDSLEAPSYDDVTVMAAALDGWDATAPKDRLLIGFTATPNRSDGIGLGAVLQSLVFTYPIKRAIEDQWLVPIAAWVIETKSTLDQVKLNRGDFNQRELAEAVNNPARNALAIAAWQEHAGDQPTIVFTVDVQHAHDLAAAFVAAGARFKALSGETPKDERRAMLQELRSGALDGICNCMVLTEGTDLPMVSCIVHAKPTKSATLYEQMTGRGLRIHPGKTECTVIDLVDIARKHSLQTAPVLYGLPPGIKANGEDLGTLENQLEEFLRKHPGFNLESAGRKTMAELNAWAATFDVWAVPSLGAFGNGRALQWIKSGLDEYRLEYPWLDGFERLKVARDLLDRFSVSLTFRPREGGAVRQRTIAHEIETADAAAGLAEAFVLQERRAVMKLKSADAPWRARAASEKQIELLQRMRVPVKPGLLAGEASDLIDVAQQRRKR